MPYLDYLDGDERLAFEIAERKRREEERERQRQEQLRQLQPASRITAVGEGQLQPITRPYNDFAPNRPEVADRFIDPLRQRQVIAPAPSFAPSPSIRPLSMLNAQRRTAGLPEGVRPVLDSGQEGRPFLDVMTRPTIPQSVLRPISRVPVIGKPLADVVGSASSPLGLATLPFGLGSAATAKMTLAGIGGSIGLGAAGEAAEELGVRPINTPIGPIGPRTAGEFVGGFATPGMMTAPGRAVRGAFARGLEEQGGVVGVARRLATEETGGRRFQARGRNLDEAIQMAKNAGYDKPLYIDAMNNRGFNIGEVKPSSNAAHYIVHPSGNVERVASTAEQVPERAHPMITLAGDVADVMDPTKFGRHLLQVSKEAYPTGVSGKFIKANRILSNPRDTRLQKAAKFIQAAEEAGIHQDDILVAARRSGVDIPDAAFLLPPRAATPAEVLPVGAKPESFVTNHLLRQGEGQPGITTLDFPADPQSGMGRRVEITYRSADGRPIGYLEAIETRRGLVAETLVADSNAGLAKGRAVKALIEEAQQQGVTGVGGTVTPDAQRLLQRLRRGTMPPEATDELARRPSLVDTEPVPPLRSDIDSGAGIPRPSEGSTGDLGSPPRGRGPIEATPTGPGDTPKPVLGERGYSGAEAIIATKEETLRRAGRVTQLPGVKQALSVLNPSVGMARPIHVATAAKQATVASLEQEFHALRKPVQEALERAWKDAKPTYVGPSANPIKLTIKDFADNPEHYTNVSSELRQAADNYNAVSDTILRKVRTEFGVDVAPYDSGKVGSFYLPTVATRESVEKKLETVAGAFTSANVTGKSGVAKTRLYEGAYQRILKNPNFKPETDLVELTAAHDRALAEMAGKETFRLGAGGKTRMEVIDEIHPGLREAKDKAIADMQSLRNRIDTVYERLKKFGYAENRLSAAERQNDTRFQRIAERYALLEDAGTEMGPQYKDLLNRAQELEWRAAGLRRLTGSAAGKKAAAQARLGDLQQQVRQLQPRLNQLRKAYLNANPGDYVMSQKTFRYHTPEQAASIDRVLQTRFPIANSVLDMVDEVRMTSFGGDISPTTIQGFLGALADPVTLIRNAKGVLEEAITGGKLNALAEAEPEMVRRYNIAMGRVLGQLTGEFRQAGKGPSRIPGIGKVWDLINDRAFGVAEYFRYQAWKTDSMILEKVGGKTANVADSEAANAWSKIMPALNPTERGASTLQAKLERLPIVSSSFIAAPPTLIKDAASGLAKLGASRTLSPVARWQELAGREQLAVLRLTTMAGTAMGMGVASYIAAGYSPEEAAKIVLTPGSRFLGVATSKDGYIPIGGPFRSFIKGVLPKKMYIDNKAVWMPFGGTVQFLRGKLTPAISTSVDLVRNRDFLDNKIVEGDFPNNVLKGLWYTAERFSPLTGGAVSQQIRTGEPSDIGNLATKAGTQMLGVSHYETAPSTRRNEISHERYGKNYSDLDISQKKAIDSQVQELTKKIDEGQRKRGDAFQKASDQVAEYRTKQRAEQEKDDAAAQASNMSIDQWKDNFYTRQAQSGAVADEIYKALGAQFDEKKDLPPERAALEAYFKVDAEKYRDPKTREIDSVAFWAEREKALAPLTPEQRAAVQGEIDKYLTPFAKQARQAAALYRQLPPKYKGLTKAAEQELRDFNQQVSERQVELYRETKRQRSERYVARKLSQEMGRPDLYKWNRILASPRRVRRYLDPVFDAYLIQHRAEMERFYPKMYDSITTEKRLKKRAA